MRKKKNILVLAVSAIIAAGILAGCGKSGDKSDGSYVDLAEYYGVSGAGQYGIVVDGKPVGTAVTVDDKIYLPQQVVADSINNQFYLDKDNNSIRYASPNAVTVAKADSSQGRVITYEGEVYLELTYVADYSEVKQIVETSPDRLVFFTEMGEIDTYSSNDGVKMRKDASADSAIMIKLAAGQKLYSYPKEDVADSSGKWLCVATEDGIKGYVRNDQVKEAEMVTVTSNKEQPEYTHRLMDEKVCLGWQLMTNTAGNDSLMSKIEGTDGLNVISPTWFVVSDTDGNITSYASKKYVDTAHANNLQVWALINDFELNESGASYVLEAIAHTDSRDNLIENIISEIKDCGADGINVDFEKISLAYGKDYVQFVRELSVKCRNEGIVLSVDMYVPMNFNKYYGRQTVGKVADYLIIMGYDEHWSGGSEAGSVASIDYVKNGIVNTVQEVDADRVINAVPFYTRIWSETPADMSDGSGVYVEDPINGNYYLGSRAVGMDMAESELSQAGAEKMWLEDIGQYYGEYAKDGVNYRVWLEEERSMELKLNAMEEAGLAGVACWQLGYEKAEIWEVIGQYLNK